MSGFDWSELMRAGLQGLHLNPDAFWRLTPAELRLMLGEGAQPSLDRTGLDALLAKYPDMTDGEANDGT